MAGKGNPSWTKGGPSPNPTGVRKDAAGTRKARSDGWGNVLTGIGSSAHDKRMTSEFRVCPVSEDEARAYWRADPMGARIVETQPNEMMREGYEICVSDPAFEGRKLTAQDRQSLKEKKEAIRKRAKELKVNQKIHLSLCNERAVGGGAIFLGANDGAVDLKQPLDMERVRSLDWLTTLEPRELTPRATYASVQAPQFGEVALYSVTPIITGSSLSPVTQIQDVHESRLVIFPGIRTTRMQEEGIRPGWGDNIFTRVKSALRDSSMSWSSAAILIQDFAQAIFKMKGLAQIVVKDELETFKLRMQAMELGRSIARAILIDSEEEFERKSTDVSGLAELLDRLMQMLAAAADMPLTLLLGMSPSGLNATGASDIRFFYDRVASAQLQKAEPAVLKILECISRSLGYGDLQISIKWTPLWQPTAAEEATRKKTIADTDAIYIDRQVYSPEVARERFKGDEFASDVHIDDEDDEYDDTLSPEDPAMQGLRTEDPNAPAPAPFPAPSPGSNAPAGVPVQATAFNGTQISGLLDIVKAVGNKEISRESGIAILVAAYPIDEAKANSILGPENFEPVKPPAPTLSPAFGGKSPTTPPAPKEVPAP